MDWNHLTVRNPRADCIMLAVCSVILEIGLIILSFDPEFRRLGVILALGLFAVVFTALFSMLWFRVEVAGENIRVRTLFKGEYSFACGEIISIDCAIRDSSRYGTNYFIILKTQAHELQVDAKKTNFSALADYLLRQHKLGVIRAAAISGSCGMSLQEYKNGEIYAKKRT